MKRAPSTQRSTLAATVRTASDDVDSSELRNRIARVLSQIRVQNLDVTVHKLKSMAIKSEEKLSTLVKTIFEKSVNDPQNTETYTKLCEQLSGFQVVSGESECVCFKNLLEKHCRQELQTCFSTDESDSSHQWRQKMDNIGFRSPEARSGVTLTGVAKWKKIGCVMLLGHLFKAQMLTVNVMKAAITKLFSLEDEDSWNCLCSLLLLIGRDMEASKQDLGSCLTKMSEAVSKRQLSESARHNLKLVSESRRNEWRKVEVLRGLYCDFPKRGPSVMGEDHKEDDDAWALGTLSHIVVPRRVLRNQMRQAKGRFNQT
ncbi:eukaryotic translation initiation factor 4 gamma 1-like [Cryptotermes secundus]|uniref:eukaryotic translation initiation factor 4 gamma 1-like n=1 Tax=Cryptotermes secundus TaxID=105785 RepID=UPI000CD7DEFC|nr:eukaryotic translation initiation factor 4 gamma 1-like [Cryptotermes secundus]XP_033607668.1 eukaryotic translation initiation factor 4 gamma 1-like [Cryptotermes secundus]